MVKREEVKHEREDWTRTGLGDSQKDTGDEEAFKALDESHSDHDTTPGQHDDGEPHRRSIGIVRTQQRRRKMNEFFLLFDKRKERDRATHRHAFITLRKVASLGVSCMITC